uniref:Reverse transcriptase domain-containing protein n=1 Tax=Tanacetum cinerariifolium TaxID=118510 RepID=A0A6L2L291_TANCI|nr:reverse transcriptase domain-containing protein [Tanacetum cinerariifolium]
MTQEVLDELISQRAANALAIYVANRNSRDDSRSHDSRSVERRTVHTTRGCTYKEFLNCQTLIFKGTKGAVELALLCARMLPNESDKVENYTGGLPDSIQGNVMSARPKTLQEAIELAKDLMDQKVRTYAERRADNKRYLTTTQETIMISNHLTKGNMWLGLTLLGLVKRKCMLELYPCETSAIFTTMGRALESARTTKELVM